MSDRSNIPIINYHKIIPSYDIGITTRHPEQFRNDLKTIQELDYHPITFVDLLASTAIPENSIIITFDDGYESLLDYAIPAMLDLGFKGVIFIPVQYIGKYNDWDVQYGRFRFKHLNNRQLVELKEQGFEIGSHAQSHRLLTHLKKDELKHEINESKKHLETIIQSEITAISYPFGRFTQEIIKQSRQAGYHFGLASIHYKKISEEDRMYTLRRYNIYRFDTQRQLKQKMNLLPNWEITMRDWIIQKGGLATALLQKCKP